MDNKYSTRSIFSEKVAIVKFNENEARQNGSDMNGEQTERTKSEKFKAGYIKRIKSNSL